MKRTPQWKDLTAFEKGYVSAALWTTDPSPIQGEHFESPRMFDRWARLTSTTLERMRSDCAKFQSENKGDLDLYFQDETQNGVDFWLTRNGHGCGFWDKSPSGNDAQDAAGQRLTKAAHAYGEVDLETYKGRIY